MIGWLIVFAYMELYAAGLCVLLKRLGCPRYGLCLIPFAAFWYTDRLTDGFRLLVFPVRSWFKTAIAFCAVAVLAQIYAGWGAHHIRPDSVRYLSDLMALPVGLAIFVGWVGTASAARRILFRLKASFKHDMLVCLLLLPVPVLLACARNRSETVFFSAAAERDSSEYKEVNL